MSDARDWIRELSESGWKQTHATVWQAPCGCYFRGPYRAWVEMNGAHLANHIAAGGSAQPQSGEPHTK